MVRRHGLTVLAVAAVGLTAPCYNRPPNSLYRALYMICEKNVIAQTWEGQIWFSANEVCYVKKALLPPMIVA